MPTHPHAHKFECKQAHLYTHMRTQQHTHMQKLSDYLDGKTDLRLGTLMP